MNKELEKRIQQIEQRNAKVEADKAWETSVLRRVCIIIATYVTITIFLMVIDAKQPFINAIVPCLGFTLSTLSVSWVKQYWTTKRVNAA